MQPGDATQREQQSPGLVRMAMSFGVVAFGQSTNDTRSKTRQSVEHRAYLCVGARFPKREAEYNSEEAARQAQADERDEKCARNLNYR